MTSLVSNAPVLRPRGARPPANSSKPLQQASSRMTSSSSTSSTTSLTSQLPSAVSNVSLFLTNLRLLDLDLHPDWPGINPLTFTIKDAGQGQKKRIQSVEWALYQLFALWDPEEANNKLRPFFPPLDQVQSLNLRAALLRSLEQAKKTGVLGRDAVIRKTMLDECKGERLEEVLAVFSSAVLKKLVAEQQLNEPEYPALAQTLALENRGYSGERAELDVLVLAHRVSLSRHLRDKNAARAQFRDFAELLDLKDRSLVHRREQARALEAQEQASGKLGQITNDVKLEVSRAVRNNWSGSERWMETLISGDVHSRTDGLLSTHFDKVWRRVRSGRLPELEDQAAGLLQQLDRRVKTQRERLEKWKAFHADIHEVSPLGPTPATGQPWFKRKGIDLAFDLHENLHLGRLSPRKLSRGMPGQLTAEYLEIVSSLVGKLARIDKGSAVGRYPPMRSLLKPADEQLETANEEVISEISELEEETPHAVSLSQGETGKSITGESVCGIEGSIPINMGRVDDDEPPFVRPKLSPTTPIQSPVASTKRTVDLSPTRTPPFGGPRTRGSRSPTRRTPSPTKNYRPAPAQGPTDLTRELADQILASMNATSPSPVKKPRHTLSLAERTRLSMARRGSRGPTLNDDEDDEPDLDTLSLPRPPTVTVNGIASNAHDSQLKEEPEYEDLVARTRRSMAGFDAARKKAQLERRRSQRESRQMGVSTHRRDGSTYFPSVDEEGDTTLLLAEELMNNEKDDYEAIFKSRPKVKTSPVGTPVKEWED